MFVGISFSIIVTKLVIVIDLGRLLHGFWNPSPSAFMLESGKGNDYLDIPLALRGVLMLLTLTPIL